MTWHAVPAVKAALAEATERWPNRNKASDGTIGDPAHSNRTSDHNPDERGHVLAFDLTCDLDNGCDAHALVREAVARGDRRIKYAISQRQIWSHARRKEGWRPYSGPNPHEKHAHISVERRHENDTSPWWPTPEPPPSVEEDMRLHPDDIELIAKRTAAHVADGTKIYGTDNLRRLLERAIISIDDMRALLNENPPEEAP